MNIKDFIRHLNISTLVEVGCHNGSDTREFREMHPNARIVCFEPDPRNLTLLKDFAIDKIAEIYPYALSDTNGMSNFYMSSGDAKGLDVPEILQQYDWSLSSSLKVPSGHIQAHPWITFPTKTSVTTIRLDDFEPLKNVTIDFIWADVQGAEDLVFSGAVETLKRTRYIFTEYSIRELYTGQLTKDGILKLLGPSWRVVHDFQGDILLENKMLHEVT
jgi:FkbM family methyltransferase